MEQNKKSNSCINLVIMSCHSYFHKSFETFQPVHKVRKSYSKELFASIHYHKDCRLQAALLDAMKNSHTDFNLWNNFDS